MKTIQKHQREGCERERINRSARSSNSIGGITMEMNALSMIVEKNQEDRILLLSLPNKMRGTQKYDSHIQKKGSYNLLKRDDHNNRWSNTQGRVNPKHQQKSNYIGRQPCTSKPKASLGRSDKDISGEAALEVKDHSPEVYPRRQMEDTRSTVRDNRVSLSVSKEFASIKLTGIEKSITQMDIKETIVMTCRKECGNIICGIRKGKDGLKEAPVICQSTIANELLKLREIKMGGIFIKVSETPCRRTKCYRCMATGHKSYKCPSKTDRSDVCFNCGEKYHMTINCNKPSCCPVCGEGTSIGSLRWGCEMSTMSTGS